MENKSDRTVTRSLLILNNSKNISALYELLLANLSPISTIYINELRQITSSIRAFLGNNNNIINEQVYKIIEDSISSISRLIRITSHSYFPINVVDREIRQIYKNGYAFNLGERFMDRKDFLLLIDNGLELGNEESQHTPTEYTNNRSQESRLKKYGYSVGQNSHLSDRKRQELLKELITTGKVSKPYVISYLKHNIQINGRKSSNEFAVSKWKDDLNFVYNL